MLSECIGNKIQQLMAQKGWNQVELAKRSGVSQVQIGRLLSGKQKDPRGSTLGKLAKAFGITVSELQGESPPIPSAIPLTRIPVLGRIPAGFPEQIPPDEIIEYISLPEVPKGCFALIIAGDSMAPTIKNGDYVLFMPDIEILNGDVVVVNDEWGESMLKRFRQKDKEVMLTSDNPEYPAIKPNDQYRIMGKVIRAWRALNI